MTHAMVMFFFLALAVVLIGLLFWATRPPKLVPHPVEDIFELLSQQRHCLRLSFIQRALQPEDTEFLGETGNRGLMRGIRAERRRIALHYLDDLQQEFETLLEISRAMAVMAPEVVAVEEMERWKLSLAFAMNCTLLRWRLYLRLRPVSGFISISSMATGMVRHLEAATASITENALGAGDFSELDLNERDND
ncbi:MAG TPA: hypothetical protein VLX60_06395 [Terriglobales bacterium]|nr:hypothetical protein [Terriglobales bacterium]